jgi:hypothetical protein
MTRRALFALPALFRRKPKPIDMPTDRDIQSPARLFIATCTARWRAATVLPPFSSMHTTN